MDECNGLCLGQNHQFRKSGMVKTVQPRCLNQRANLLRAPFSYLHYCKRRSPALHVVRLDALALCGIPVVVPCKHVSGRAHLRMPQETLKPCAASLCSSKPIPALDQCACDYQVTGYHHEPAGHGQPCPFACRPEP